MPSWVLEKKHGKRQGAHYSVFYQEMRYVRQLLYVINFIVCVCVSVSVSLTVSVSVIQLDVPNRETDVIVPLIKSVY